MLFAAIFLFVALVAFRLLAAFNGAGSDFVNFSPIAALFLCGAAFLPRKIALTVPLAAMLITDVALNLKGGYPIFTFGMALRYLAFGMIFVIGLQFRKPSARGAFNWKLFGGAVVGTLLFYTISNTGSWLSLPAYSKTLAGWWQAQTVGLPGFPPTFLFLRNSLAGDLFFTALFVACFALAGRRSTSVVPGEPLAAGATH